MTACTEWQMCELPSGRDGEGQRGMPEEGSA
jgi:hypothetical protein